jgi:uncharacterized protein YjiS (DUF1127 family)
MLRTRTFIAPPRAAGRKILGALRRRLSRMRAAVEAWLRRTRQRRALIWLDDGLLQDIGLPPEQSDADKLMPFRFPRQF